MEKENVKELMKKYRDYDCNNSINVTLIFEVYGNSILREYRYFSSERHFFMFYVYDRLVEDFEILHYDKENCELLLKKKDVIIRCFW